MNKWVVFVLIALAFLAGGLSSGFLNRPETASDAPIAAQTEASPLLATPAPTSATPALGRQPVASRTGPPREPHFGVPGKTTASTSTPGGATQTNPTGPSEKPPLMPKAEIRASVFSTTAEGPALTRFPTNSDNIYMTVSPKGVPEDVELVASLRSVLTEGENFSTPVQSSGPPGRRSFRFVPPATGWKSGPYQILVKPAGGEQIVGYSRFEVDKAGAAADKKHENPEYLRLVGDLSSSEPISVFHSNDPQIHLKIASYKVSPASKIRSVWSAVEVDQLTRGELVAVSETTPPGPDEDAVFTFSPPKTGFLPGSYRVDVYFDQQPVGNQAFFIQPAPIEGNTETSTP